MDLMIDVASTEKDAKPKSISIRVIRLLIANIEHKLMIFKPNPDDSLSP